MQVAGPNFRQTHECMCYDVGCVTYNVIGTVKIESFDLDIVHSGDFCHDSA